MRRTRSACEIGLTTACLALAAALFGTGCEPPPIGSDACFAGMWDGAADDCGLTCDGRDDPTICAASDCRMVSFQTFDPQGERWVGSYLYSETQRSIRLFTTPTESGWRGSLQDGVEIRDGTEEFRSTELQCRQDGRLTIDLALYSRTPTDREETVRSAIATGVPEGTY